MKSDKILAPYLPDNAPFTDAQRSWLNGFFAGWASSQLPDAEMPLLNGEMVMHGDGAAGDLPGLALSGMENELVQETNAYSRSNPFLATLQENRLLSSPGSKKEVRHIEINLASSGLAYEVGDALGIVPRNRQELIEQVMMQRGWTGVESVTCKGQVMSLWEALENACDIRTLTKATLEHFASESGDVKLLDLVNTGSREVLADFMWGKDMLDLLEAYPAVCTDPQVFVDQLRPLAHRLYSISSSLKAHPDEVHLTVGVVRYDVESRQRHGVCSTFLADRCGAEEGTLPVFIHPNKAFRLPDNPDTPVIMIGPGTGIAPFRAFIEERMITGATGENWLFFGDQHASTDFLYREEINAWQTGGALTRLDCAWSRDSSEKVYVQHKMLEQATLLYDWLEKGAAVYVCGDASRMARDVDAALHKVIRKAGGKSEAAAVDYVKQMKKSKRYQRDVY